MISVILEDRLATVTARRDVVQRAFELDANGSGHQASLQHAVTDASILDLAPRPLDPETA